MMCVLVFRHCSVGASSGKPHLSPVFGVTQREAVMECAGECVRGEGRERKRRENRAELIGQLEEVELSERKERSKVNSTNPQFTLLLLFYVTLSLPGGRPCQSGVPLVGCLEQDTCCLKCHVSTHEVRIPHLSGHH